MFSTILPILSIPVEAPQVSQACPPTQRNTMTSIPPLPATFDIASEFPIVTRWAFFNHAGVAPIARRAQRAIEQYAAEAVNDAYLTGRWYKQAERTRHAAAKLIHADAAEIAFIKNTSEGLAFVANGLQWNAGDQVISTNVEYPSNVYPWMNLARRYGVEHVMIPERNGRIVTADVLNAITPRTRMVALSHVEYASGYCNDLATIGRVCRERGVLLCVDAIQSCGVLPVDVQAMNIDFLAADGHKWLLAPEGLGIFYCRRALMPQVEPEIGWMNVVNATDWGNYNFTLRDDAKRFECGSYNIPGVLALGAALEVLHEVGIDLIQQRVLGLTDLLVALLDRKGYQVFSPRGPGESSGIVSFTSSRHDHGQIVQMLERQKIIIVTRGGRLRASPHFYNTPAQIAQLVEALP